MKDKLQYFSWFAVDLLVLSQGGIELISVVLISVITGFIAYKFVSFKTGMKELQLKEELSIYERQELQDKEELAVFIGLVVFFLTFIVVVIALAVTC